jgi:phosphoribosyl 1,2-cyclic phosphodiesterase
MRVINLASGSKGNLTYIENENTKILVDMGLSCQESIKRLSLLGVSPDQIDGILVTHEHSDHIKGIDVFSKKYNKPIFAHNDVWVGLDDQLKNVKSENRKIFTGDFEFKELIVRPVEVPHDVKCFGYTIEKDNQKVSLLTDLGHTNDKIIESVKGSQLVYIEANYDRQRLYNNDRYPLSLKRRIDGANGHLSNIDSASAIERLIESGTRQIVLSHLSEENNTPELAYEEICAILSKHGMFEGMDFKIDVATQKPGVIFRLK